MPEARIFSGARAVVGVARFGPVVLPVIALGTVDHSDRTGVFPARSFRIGEAVAINVSQVRHINGSGMAPPFCKLRTEEPRYFLLGTAVTLMGPP